jgi:hypothetical protein
MKEVTMIKHVAWVRETRNTYRDLVEKPIVKWPLRRQEEIEGQCWGYHRLNRL